MPVNVHEITEADWSQQLNAPGEVVTGIDDINQCVLIILTTEPGTDPLRPDFGAGVMRWLDRPASEAVPRIKKDIYEALSIWETRIIVTKITHSISGEALTVVVDWMTAAGDQSQGEVTYYYGVGRA